MRAIVNAAIERNGHEPTNEELAAELLESGDLNPWQISQLLEARTRFTLSQYRIVDSIGQGGYGQVFLARDPGARSQTFGDSLVALKVLPFNKATPELIERFHREIDIQRNLIHPNLVKFIDSGHDANVHFMVHEYVEGGDLRQRIRRDDRLSVSSAAKITIQIADAIRYLHECGIVHRDIKPANILLGHNGEAKLADMGFAVKVHRPRENETVTESMLESMLNEAIEDFAGSKNSETSGEMQPELEIGRMKWKLHGTADFMAPDQIRNPHSPSPAWDIYSLGCSLYQMVTGIVPFPRGTARQKIMAQLQQEPPDPRMFCQSLPFDIVALLWEMTAKNPQERIDSLVEVRERLRPWVAESNITAKSLDFADVNEEIRGEKIIIPCGDLGEELLGHKNHNTPAIYHMSSLADPDIPPIRVPPILPDDISNDLHTEEKSFPFNLLQLSDRQWQAIEIILTISLCFLSPIAIILLFFVLFCGLF